MSKQKFTDRAVDGTEMEVLIPHESRKSDYWCATLSITEMWAAMDEGPSHASISLDIRSMRRLRDMLNEAKL